MSFSNDIGETRLSNILLSNFNLSTPIRIYRPKDDTDKSSNKSNRSSVSATKENIDQKFHKVALERLKSELKVEIQEGIISYNRSIEYLRSAVDIAQIEIYFM